jgi:hypothetical protein
MDDDRFDRLQSAVEWVLGHDPYYFPVVPDTLIVRIKTRPGAFGYPSLTMYATIDDANTCTLQWIELTTGDAGPDALTEYDLESYEEAPGDDAEK